MKASYLALVISITLLVACNSDNDDHHSVSPEVITSVTINDAETIDLLVDEILLNDGSILFSLTTDDAKPITHLTDIQLLYIGYPDENWQATQEESNLKLPWHQNMIVHCSESSCDGVLEEYQVGSYRFTPEQFNWNRDITRYKVMLTVQGALAKAEYPLSEI